MKENKNFSKSQELLN